MKIEDTNYKLRVAAYIRVSTDHPNQEDSYELQEQYFSNLLNAHDEWISAGIYCDQGISATSKARRTGFLRLMRHCEQGKVDRIVCKSISRFARNTADFLSAIQIMREHRVSILFEKEKIDTLDAGNDFVLTTLGAIAQEESRSISENVRWGLEKRYPKGDVVNYAIYGYRYAQGKDAFETTDSGYVRRRIEIVPEEAAVIRRIYERVAEGESFAAIARELNWDHIPAPGEKKKNPDVGWTLDRISDIAYQERYAGDVLVQKNFTSDYLTHKIRKNRGEKTQYYVKNHHPAIVDRELYEQVQKALAGRKKHGGTKGRYPFSRRLICGHCGRTCYTRNRSRRPIWYCPSTALHNGKIICTVEPVSEERIVGMFRKAILQRYTLMEDAADENRIAEDIANGRFVDENEYKYAPEFADFVKRMRQRMEEFQKTDDMERARASLRRQVQEAGRTYESTCRKYATVQEISPADFDDYAAVQIECSDAQERLDTLRNQQEDMEAYWSALEEDYESREKAIEWMAGLPEGRTGTLAFFAELSDTSIQAFALSITIHTPSHFTVRWFDDVESEVTL